MMRPVLGLLARLPRTWTASVRRRRLLFLATTLPGVAVAELGAGVLHQLTVLALGAGLVLAAFGLRWLGEPRFLARERRALTEANELEDPA